MFPTNSTQSKNGTCNDHGEEKKLEDIDGSVVMEPPQTHSPALTIGSTSSKIKICLQENDCSGSTALCGGDISKVDSACADVGIPAMNNKQILSKISSSNICPTKSQEGIEHILTEQESSLMQDDGSDYSNSDGSSNLMTSLNCRSNKSERTRLEWWSDFTAILRAPLLRFMVSMSRFSARYPVWVIVSTIVVSIGLPTAGILTNFAVETNENILWSPPGTITARVGRWVSAYSGFPHTTPSMIGILTAQDQDGRLSSVTTVEAMERAFEVYDVVRNLPKYRALCGTLVNCNAKSPTGFWENHNVTLFRDDVSTDEGVQLRVASFLNANGELVERDLVLGNSEPRLNVTRFEEFSRRQMIINSLPFNQKNEGDAFYRVMEQAMEEFPVYSAESLLFDWGIPVNHEDPVIVKMALELELDAVDAILALNERWSKEYDQGILPLMERNVYQFTINISTIQSLHSELIRSIMDDFPTLTLAFITMMIFCLYSLNRFHFVKSHSTMGIGAVVTILLAVLAGYGVMFILGVPLTTLTYLFPYGMLGLGLDAVFILTGQFSYTDPTLDIVDRITAMVEEVGLSIAVSSLTTCSAYALGSMAKMVGLRWFCWYAIITILFNTFYMLTFFVAIMVVDDRRIRANRFDMCCCFVYRDNKYVEKYSDGPNSPTHQETMQQEEERRAKLISNKIMNFYSRVLMKPAVKVFTLLFFLALAIGGSYIASGIKMSLPVHLLFPQDSFVQDYFGVLFDRTTLRDFDVGAAYFRDVDVSDPDVQDAMIDYVEDIVSMPYVSSNPLLFWIRDFRLYKAQNDTLRQYEGDFYKQLDMFLTTEPYQSLYKNDILRDPQTNKIIASRTIIIFDQVETGPDGADTQLEAFNALWDLTRKQEINSGFEDNPKFFTYGEAFPSWELWSILFKEISQTVYLSLGALFVICLVFVNHPLPAFLLTPTVFFINVEVIAVYRLAGITINPLSCIGLVTCLGLVMDYATHICITYFEIHDATDRNERVTRTINTMGKSILKGGFTTFLGVLFVSWKYELAFRVVFITYLGITTLGVGHGLIFIPVVLSLVGPMPKKIPREAGVDDFEEHYDQHNDKVNGGAMSMPLPPETP